jgi:hypothetical protein
LLRVSAQGKRDVLDDFSSQTWIGAFPLLLHGGVDLFATTYQPRLILETRHSTYSSRVDCKNVYVVLVGPDDIVDQILGVQNHTELRRERYQ